MGDVHKFLPGVQLVHVRNTGVAFGFFSGGGALVLVLTLVALAALVVYFALRPDRPWLWLPIGLLIGGRAGEPDRPAAQRLGDRLHQAPAVAGVQRRRHGDHVRRAALLYVLEGPRGSRERSEQRP